MCILQTAVRGRSVLTGSRLSRGEIRQAVSCDCDDQLQDDQYSRIRRLCKMAAGLQASSTHVPPGESSRPYAYLMSGNIRDASRVWELVYCWSER